MKNKVEDETIILKAFAAALILPSLICRGYPDRTDALGREDIVSDAYDFAGRIVARIPREKP